MTSPGTTTKPIRPTRSERGRALGVQPSVATATRPAYLPALDGLRAVAVVAVVAFHLGRLDGGFLGVDVFFVLSGFLITRLLLAERSGTGRISLRAFWQRRVRRLLPGLLLLLPVVVVMSRAWLPAWRLSGIRTDSLAALFYFANWRFVASGQSYFASGIGPSPLRHTWSLGVEEQFYVLWPLLVIATFAVAGKRRSVGVAAMCATVTVASASWMAWLATHGGDLTRVYYGTDTRIFAMSAGALVAALLHGRVVDSQDPRRTAGVATVGALALVGLGVGFVIGREDAASFYRGGFQAVAVLTALAVAALTIAPGPLGRLLGCAPMRWLGRRSYSFYLWSWPVQILARARFGPQPTVALDAAVVAVSLLAASLSFALVEQPVMQGRWPLQVRARERASTRGSGMPGRVAWRPVVGVMAVLSTVALVVGVTAGSPPPPDFLTVKDRDVTERALSSEGFATGDAATRTTVAAPVTPSTTLPSDPVLAPLDPGPDPPFDPAAPTVVAVRDVRPSQVFHRPLRVTLIGDSVGWSIGWALGGDLQPEVDLQVRALIGCGTIAHDAEWGIAGVVWNTYIDHCAQQAEAERLGFDAGPDVVLMWVGAWEVFDQRLGGVDYTVGSARYAEMLRTRVQQRIDEARRRGIPFLLSVVPCFGVSENALHNERRLDREAVAWVNRQLRAVAERNPGWVRMVDPSGVLCDRDGNAIGSVDGIVLRHDGSHFTRDSALWLWRNWLDAAIASAFPTTGTPR